MPGVAQRVGRGIALLFHDRGTRREWVVSTTPRPHFTPGKDSVLILQEAGCAPGSVWTGGKSRPDRESIPDRAARNQSLYRYSSTQTQPQSQKEMAAQRQAPVALAPWKRLGVHCTGGWVGLGDGVSCISTYAYSFTQWAVIVLLRQRLGSDWTARVSNPGRRKKCFSPPKRLYRLWGHPASYYNGTGVHSRGKSGRGVKTTT